MSKTSANRMTEGSIAKALFSFTMPILLGNIFQQLYNTADALIVGNLLGSTALAAVSSVGSIMWLMIGLFNGFAQGSGVIIARYYGAKDNESLKKAIHTHMIVCAAAGVIITILGSVLSPWIVSLMNTPENVVDQSISYLRIFFIGTLGLTLYNGSTGLMHAVGDSRHPLYYLIFSSMLNVLLDITFIKFFGMDVGGAALATIIAQFISAVLCLVRLFSTGDVYRLSMSEMKADRTVLRQIFRYGAPAAFQNAITSIGNTVLQANVNAFGDMAMAGVGAVNRIEGFITQPVVSLATSLATFTSQNLGAQEYKRAKRGALYGTVAAIAMAELIGLVFMFMPEPLISLFTKEPEAIVFGARRVQIVAGFYFALAATHTLAGVMRGAGKPFVTMVAFVGMWCCLRVFILTVFVPIYETIDLVYAVFPITWCCSAVYLAIYTLSGRWLKVRDLSKEMK